MPGPRVRAHSLSMTLVDPERGVRRSSRYWRGCIANMLPRVRAAACGIHVASPAGSVSADFTQFAHGTGGLRSAAASRLAEHDTAYASGRHRGRAARAGGAVQHPGHPGLDHPAAEPELPKRAGTVGT